jgi:putative ABC transport system ATP-binding protein
MHATLNNTSVIRAERISKTVRSGEKMLTIVADVNLYINPGETVAILGASGAGKSTLLGLLAGLDTPSTGDIYLNQQNITAMDEDGRARARAGQVGFIFQSFQLLPSLTALENIMLPLELNAIPQPKQKAMVWLERVGLTARGHHYPQQLSGGEQQRVAIARAFAIEPKVLFADEPTGNLDQQTGQKIIDLLFELNNKQGATLVIVTHDENLAARCQRKITLTAGHIV